MAPKLILGLYTVRKRMVALPLFAASAYHGSDPVVLVSHPMTNLKKALELIRNHADMGHHKKAVVRVEGFLKMMMHK